MRIYAIVRLVANLAFFIALAPWPADAAHLPPANCRADPAWNGQDRLPFMTFNDLRIAIFLIAISPMPLGAITQNNQQSTCTDQQDLKATQLYGLWEARFSKPPAGLPARATMRLQQHAEFTESLAGLVTRELGAAAGSPAIAGHAHQAALAGDLEDGRLLLLDESSDRISITGTWNGELVEGSCGKQFQGSWKDTSRSAADNAPDVPFTLTKLP
jgi:hypothetical protein